VNAVSPLRLRFVKVGEKGFAIVLFDAPPLTATPFIFAGSHEHGIGNSELLLTLLDELYGMNIRWVYVHTDYLFVPNAAQDFMSEMLIYALQDAGYELQLQPPHEEVVRDASDSPAERA
jgi:hypothetical protein